ncbi:lysophospholipase [Rhodovulum sulfidophilum]|uniref:DUF1489 domain-containing protein n=1 Tax=Rhodovulum visakhapatnamense TaxID=364297 RepID=A0ABS1RIR0_9RHOB|nr:DUF1489 domain-containing protein [Rhodovulum visakhapatnamense]MBL3571618.1 DUF1489 domain-containing protein [Rhodovulum visakhapatnamense]MBL3579044.1 DUF1489 domain-containing protein [Rhodovulum visakhapatnamense]OLS46101.1 lysophospholipase [Rhodovulum sulfidophilum]
MAGGHVNLVKLCVGADRVEDLIDWQTARRAALPDGLPRHVTRMWPKRAADLLDGGSLYWVFKGAILARQRVLRLDEVIGEDGIARCAIVLDPEVIRTEAVPRRPFQGWRYLEAGDAPRDLPATRPDEDDLPPQLMAALAEIGVR